MLNGCRSCPHAFAPPPQCKCACACVESSCFFLYFMRPMSFVNTLKWFSCCSSRVESMGMCVFVCDLWAYIIITVTCHLVSFNAAIKTVSCVYGSHDLLVRECSFIFMFFLYYFTLSHFTLFPLLPITRWLAHILAPSLQRSLLFAHSRTHPLHYVMLFHLF